MSTYGVGQGLEREVGMAANVFMRAMQLKQQDAHFQQAMDLDLIWSGSVDWLDWAPAMRMRRRLRHRPRVECQPSNTRSSRLKWDGWRPLVERRLRHRQWRVKLPPRRRPRLHRLQSS